MDKRNPIAVEWRQRMAKILRDSRKHRKEEPFVYLVTVAYYRQWKWTIERLFDMTLP